jgi:hypothetical protein
LIRTHMRSVTTDELIQQTQTIAHHVGRCLERLPSKICLL